MNEQLTSINGRLSNIEVELTDIKMQMQNFVTKDDLTAFRDEIYTLMEPLAKIVKEHEDEIKMTQSWIQRVEKRVTKHDRIMKASA